MKKVFAYFFLVSVVFLLTSNNGLAQFKLKLGPSIGMNFNIHTGSDIEGGTSVGLIFGGTLDMGFTPMIGLITNLQFYDNRSGSWSKESSAQIQDGQGNPVTVSISDERA